MQRPEPPLVYDRYSAWETPHALLAARQTYGTARTNRRFDPHYHDFAEVFWIERGRCRHTINGQEQILAPGDLVFIRPSDRHTGCGVDREGFTLVNIMIPHVAVNLLRRRYGVSPHAWPWWDGELPRTFHLSREQIDHLSALLTSLPDLPTTLDRDLVILAVVQAATVADGGLPAEAPEWLRRALTHEPDDIIDAVELARRCSKDASHVNRVVRRHFGCTTSELLLRRRLAVVAQALRTGNALVTDLALAAGFNNLAWFHRAFRARYGSTPRHYRQATQRPVYEKPR